MGPLYENWQLGTAQYSVGLCFPGQEMIPESHDSDEDDMYLFDMSMQQPLDLGPNYQFTNELTMFTLRKFIPEILLRIGPHRGARSSTKSKKGSRTHERTMNLGATSLPPMQNYLACPFYVRNPEKYLSCLTRSSLREIKELKQHLWNAHQLPRYCPTCREIFTTSRECDTHVRRRSCSIQDIPRPEGITIEQMQQLARRTDTRVSDRQQWKSLWAIVFPGTDLREVDYSSRAVELVVCLFRDYWSINGEKVMNDFLGKNRRACELVDEERSFTPLYAAVLHQTIDSLVEYFRHEDYNGMFGKAERILASLRHRD
ncbi:hypothetical protein F4820DRAFT_37596 [Hypoxylon rubiginosum]|uniref:Uncharacterized protein n=1 Tax=Hypoxylon rubiginosum TaxID=110542 RepID=A0ACB9YT03_9PEZI|nr:hypothetical protein F4820DRAFT_37596 [Hypoxylon rubiginosum]